MDGDLVLCIYIYTIYTIYMVRMDSVYRLWAPEVCIT